MYSEMTTFPNESHSPHESHSPKKTCGLCDSEALELVAPEGDSRYYYHCRRCDLISTDQMFFPDETREKACYLNHRNDLSDSGYVNFLNRVIEPAVTFFGKDMIGLDYGCGPNPVLSGLLEQKEYKSDFYDPFFFPDGITKDSYDFIFSTECFEHFHHPKQEIEKISSLLLPGGYLCMMTERWNCLEDFMTWYYKNDPTHVCFFHTRSFDYLMNQYGMKCIYNDECRVMILKKD
jgi:SAM-dependent methyltransferase